MMTPTRVRVMWLIIAVSATFLLGARQFFSGAPSRDGHKPWTQLPHSVLITRRGQAGRVLHFLKLPSRYDLEETTGRMFAELNHVRRFDSSKKRRYFQLICITKDDNRVT